jgi:peptide/nickel transport system substrate-binding protein
MVIELYVRHCNKVCKKYILQPYAQKKPWREKGGRTMRRSMMMSKIVFFAAVMLVTIGWQEVAAQSKRLAFTIDAPPYRQLEAQAIAEQLKKIGIQAEARIWEKIVLQDQVQSGERNAYLTDWGSSYFDPFDLGEPKLTTGGRGNFSFYTNPKVDEWLKMASNSSDNVARKEAYFKVQTSVFNDAPWIFGYFLKNIEAASTDVENWGPAVDNRVNLHDVKLKKGESIVVGMNVNAFITLDPAMYRDRDTETVIRNMFDGLVTRTNGADVVPELAESWEEVDPTTFVFTLRPHVKFHNGDPLTADDVVFTFERVLTAGGVGGQSSPRKGLLGPLQKVEKISAQKVKFVLGNPFPPFFQALVHFQIVPQKYIKEVGDKAFADKPIGTGPFKFVKGKLDAEVVMERFEEYYGGSPKLPPVGLAKVKKAVFRTMPEPSTRVAALLAGELTIIQAIPTDLVEKLKKSNRVQLKTVEGTRSYQIELNNKKPPFDDLRVRQAVNMAVDWDNILKNIYLGYATRLPTCFLPSGFGYDTNLKPYPYNPEKAKALLKEAGYEAK